MQGAAPPRGLWESKGKDLELGERRSLKAGLGELVSLRLGRDEAGSTSAGKIAHGAQPLLREGTAVAAGKSRY